MKKKVIETYRGMNKDISPSKFPEGFYYSATNIQIAPSDNGSTQFDVINRKASSLQYTFTSPYISSGEVKFNIDDVVTDSRVNTTQATYLINSGLLTTTEPSSLSIQGLVGYLELDDFSIIIMDFDGVHGIYKLSEDSVELLYVDNLGLTFGENFADIKYYFENDLIEKLYIAVEGQLVLYFNIVSGETYGLIGNHQIVPDINFNNITVSNAGTGGYHTAGVIQYAYSGYYKNGASSTISPLSDLIPLVNNDGRGSDVNEYVSQINLITIPQLDNFDYIKVYSIKYNEANDIPIISIIEDINNPNTELNIYDDNIILSTISSEEFLFLGGTIIKPSTIEIKDNRLFAANITEDTFDFNVNMLPGDSGYFDTRAFRFNAAGTSAQISDLSGGTKTVSNSTFRDSTTGDPFVYNFDCTQTDFDTYNYTTGGVLAYDAGAEGENIKIYLSWETASSSDDVKRLKHGEIYRYGIRALNAKGQRSAVHWICDLLTPYSGVTHTDMDEYYKVNLVIKDETKLYNQGVVGVELMRVLRTDVDKSIVCQGIANTMMFQTRDIASADQPDYRSTTIIAADEYTGKSTAYYTRELSSDDYVLYPSLLPRTIYTVAEPLGPGSIYSKCSVRKFKHLQCLSLNAADVAYGASTDSIYKLGIGPYSNDGYLDDFEGRAGIAQFGTALTYASDQYEEISSGADHDNTDIRTNRTYQYTKMWQVFSPEIEFTNIQLSGVNKVAMVGGQAIYFDFTAKSFVRAKEYYVDTNRIHLEQYATILFDTAKDFHGSSSGYGILSDQVPNLTDKYQYVYNATDTVNTRYQPYIVKEYDIYGAPEYASIGTISNAYNSDTSLVYSTILDQVTTDDLTVLNTYTKTNKSVIVVPVRDTLVVNTTNADKINHVPMEEAIYDAVNGLSPARIIQSLPIVELKRTLLNQYNGSTYEARSFNKYISISELQSISGNTNTTITSNNPGDTYLQYYKFMYNGWDALDQNNEDTVTISTTVNVPIETSINLKARNDISNNFNTTFIPTFDFMSKYNNVYSRESDVFVSTPKLFTESTITDRNNVVIASKVKTPGEVIDSFTDFLVNEEITLDGKYGEINRLYNYRDEIICFQKHGVSLLSINPRVTTIGEDGIQAELGTGKVLDRYKYISTKYGINKVDFNTIADSERSLYFYDRDSKSLCNLQGSAVVDLGLAKGVSSTVKEGGLLTNYVYNSTVNKLTDEYHFSSINHNKILGVSSNDLVLSEILNAFTHNDSDTNKIWNLNMSDGLYSLKYDTTGLVQDMYFYKAYNHATNYLPLSITYLLNPTKGIDSVRFDNMQWYSYATTPSTGLEDITSTFNSFTIDTGYQTATGAFSSYPTLYRPKRKFRIWRAPFARDDRDRYRSPYMYLTLNYTDTTHEFKFGDMIISYNI